MPTLVSRGLVHHSGSRDQDPDFLKVGGSQRYHGGLTWSTIYSLKKAWVCSSYSTVPSRLAQGGPTPPHRTQWYITSVVKMKW